MSAGMDGVIAAHSIHGMSGGTHLACRCDKKWVPHSDYNAHLVEELTKAGYGDAPAALLAAADEMPIETLAGADKASVWLRHRAHSQDPEGHALVKAIHDRKAEA